MLRVVVCLLVFLLAVEGVRALLPDLGFTSRDFH